MTRVKRGVPRKGDLFFDKKFPSLVFVYIGFNREYGLHEFEYVGTDGRIYTYGFADYNLRTNAYKLKV